MKIGCHISIQGGVENAPERAKDLGCETFQIFTQNQRQWVSKIFDQNTIMHFNNAIYSNKLNHTKVVSHASYLINLCANEKGKLNKSRKAFLEELKRCDQLGIDYVVIHPGFHMGRGELWGIKTIAQSINYIFDQYTPKVEILLETTAGHGTSIGYRFEQFQDIFSNIQLDNIIGICLDTCHTFAAGYSIKTATQWQECLNSLENTVGINRIKAIHLNDSKTECGSRKDRHAAIGTGFIGVECFKYLMNCDEFADIPSILEVPGGDEVFKENIKLLKNFRE